VPPALLPRLLLLLLLLLLPPPLLTSLPTHLLPLPPSPPPSAGQVMNCCSMGYPDASFDAILDKATLDSLLCGENSTANTGRYVGEVARTLKPGGVYIIVSFGTPENRLSYLEGDYGWTVTVHSIPKPTINTAGLPEVNSSDPSQQHVSEVASTGQGQRALSTEPSCLQVTHPRHTTPTPPPTPSLSTCTLQKSNSVL
jgi:hypothetical protein